MTCLGSALPERWWQDRDTLIAELAAHGTPGEIAKAHGVAANTISKWSARHGLPKLPPGPQARLTTVPRPDHDDGWLLQALKKRGDNATVEALADHAVSRLARARRPCT